MTANTDRAARPTTSVEDWERLLKYVEVDPARPAFHRVIDAAAMDELEPQVIALVNAGSLPYAAPGKTHPACVYVLAAVGQWHQSRGALGPLGDAGLRSCHRRPGHPPCFRLADHTGGCGAPQPEDHQRFHARKAELAARKAAEVSAKLWPHAPTPEAK